MSLTITAIAFDWNVKNTHTHTITAITLDWKNKMTSDEWPLMY